MKQNWSVRLAEVVQNLLRRDDSLAFFHKSRDFAVICGHCAVMDCIENVMDAESRIILLAIIKSNRP